MLESTSRSDLLLQVCSIIDHLSLNMGCYMGCSLGAGLPEKRTSKQ